MEGRGAASLSKVRVNLRSLFLVLVFGVFFDHLSSGDYFEDIVPGAFDVHLQHLFDLLCSLGSKGVRGKGGKGEGDE